MKNERNVPKVRFMGFCDDWEQRKLNSIADVRDGTHASPQYFSTGHPFITSKNVKDGYINYDDVQYISDEDFEEINKRSKVDVNDILMGMIGTIGNLALIREPPDFAIKNVALIKYTGAIFYLYLYHCLQSETALNQLSENMDGGTQKFVALKKIRELNIAFPSRPEQQQIGSYFRNLDNLITLHQRKYETLQKLKKSMLQKMFPKNGSLYPEFRFAGFTDAWEQRKVKELCSISTGKSNTQDKTDDGEYPFYVRSPIIERSTKYLYDEEAVITVGDGVGTGKVFHYINGKYDLHQRCYRMYGFTEKLNARYFYHTFSHLFYKRVMAMTAKTSVDSVRLEMISDMEIPTPSIDEQKLIGQYFTNLDNLITLHQRKLETLKKLKKAMLQKMFI